MKALMLLVMAACVGVIIYVVSEGTAEAYEVGGYAIDGTRAMIGAGLTFAGAAVILAGLTFLNMLKLAAWIGAALIAVGLLTGIVGAGN